MAGGEGEMGKHSSGALGRGLKMNVIDKRPDFVIVLFEMSHSVTQTGLELTM